MVKQDLTLWSSLEVDRWGHCDNNASVQVTSGWPSASQASGGYHYIVVNQRGGSSDTETNTTAKELPAVDWTTQAQVETYTASTGGQLWETLSDEPVLGSTELAERCGLMIEKPH